MWVKKAIYRQNLSDLANYREQAGQVEGLKADTARLLGAIRFKDVAFRMLNEQMQFNKQLADTLTKITDQQKAVIAGQDAVIKDKEKLIEKIGKPKRWGVGPIAGYGLAGTSFGAFIGVGVSYGLRF